MGDSVVPQSFSYLRNVKHYPASDYPRIVDILVTSDPDLARNRELYFPAEDESSAETLGVAAAGKEDNTGQRTGSHRYPERQ